MESVTTGASAVVHGTEVVSWSYGEEEDGYVEAPSVMLALWGWRVVSYSATVSSGAVGAPPAGGSVAGSGVRAVIGDVG